MHGKTKKPDYDIATHKIVVTFFKNAFAKSLDMQSMTLPELRELIVRTTGSTKGKLPWLKLARFGTKKTKQGSFRHDANVTEFTGIELDYDKGQISIDEAVGILKAMKVRALIYATPSHTEAFPKWRLLLPVSCKLPLEMRAKLCTRVNGRFGNIFDAASFALSQSYYFGQALDNPAPDHRAEVVDGRLINLCNDLDRFEKDSDNTDNTTAHDPGYHFREFGKRYGGRSDDDGPRGFDEHIALIGDGGGLNGYHQPLRDSVAAYAREHGADFDRDELKRQLRAAINAAPKKATRKLSEISEYLSDRYLDDIVASAVRKFSGFSAGASINTGTGKTSSSSLTPITATPYVWVDPDKIPPRRWLYRPHYIRQFTSLILSTGGVGKSSMLIIESLSMATGWALLDVHPIGKLRVWYFNGEDPTEELQRRFAAAALHYKISEKDIGDRLFVDSGRIMPIILVEEGRHGTIIAMPVVEQVIATIRDRKIDVVIIDPFVSTHRVSENDNGAIERVAKTWSHIAEVTNCSIMLAHHTRKTQGGGNVGVDDGRGAGALLAAVRVARTLNTMTTTEAEEAEIKDSERSLHYRADIGKANLTRPAEGADWFKLESIDLGNTGPLEAKDTVGVVTAWEYPSFKMPVIDDDALETALQTIEAGGPWRSNAQATTHPWVGIPIAKALKINLTSKRARKNVASLISDWLQEGYLEKTEDIDPVTRKAREFIVVRTIKSGLGHAPSKKKARF